MRCDIAPITVGVENLPVITLENRSIRWKARITFLRPDHDEGQAGGDGGMVFNYDNPETGEQRDL